MYYKRLVQNISNLFLKCLFTTIYNFNYFQLIPAKIIKSNIKKAKLQSHLGYRVLYRYWIMLQNVTDYFGMIFVIKIKFYNIIAWKRVSICHEGFAAIRGLYYNTFYGCNLRIFECNSGGRLVGPKWCLPGGGRTT